MREKELPHMIFCPKCNDRCSVRVHVATGTFGETGWACNPGEAKIVHDFLSEHHNDHPVVVTDWRDDKAMDDWEWYYWWRNKRASD